MDTPIADFLKNYAHSSVRLHMPGHKGALPNPLNSVAPFDITEIFGADRLYEADGIIAQSEENASALYQSGSTSYSAGGSTLCIQAMLSLTCHPGDTIIAARNAHLAFFNACALLDVHPIWVSPTFRDSFGVGGEVSPQAIEAALQKFPKAKAVYLTSPDYLGCISDISAISVLCKNAGIPLLVDNAHGAHLKFLKNDIHPLTLGASMCCDSAHKTLPVLTGGAYLHVQKGFPIQKKQVKNAMSLFGSTSPSYLILLSLDLCNNYLETQAKEDFWQLENRLKPIRAAFRKKGVPIVSNPMDCTRLTLDALPVGMTGNDLASFLRKRQIECEYASMRHVVLMFSPKNDDADLKKVQSAITDIPVKKPLSCLLPAFSIPKTAVSLRSAYFSEKESVPVKDAVGRIAGSTKIQCPPGVPFLAAGEFIDETAQKLLKRSGISYINVLK